MNKTYKNNKKNNNSGLWLITGALGGAYAYEKYPKVKSTVDSVVENGKKLYTDIKKTLSKDKKTEKPEVNMDHEVNIRIAQKLRASGFKDDEISAVIGVSEEDIKKWAF